MPAKADSGSLPVCTGSDGAGAGSGCWSGLSKGRFQGDLLIDRLLVLLLLLGSGLAKQGIEGHAGADSAKSAGIGDILALKDDPGWVAGVYFDVDGRDSTGIGADRVDKLLQDGLHASNIRLELLELAGAPGNL